MRGFSLCVTGFRRLVGLLSDTRAVVPLSLQAIEFTDLFDATIILCPDNALMANRLHPSYSITLKHVEAVLRDIVIDRELGPECYFATQPGGLEAAIVSLSARFQV